MLGWKFPELWTRFLSTHNLLGIDAKDTAKFRPCFKWKDIPLL